MCKVIWGLWQGRGGVHGEPFFLNHINRASEQKAPLLDLSEREKVRLFLLLGGCVAQRGKETPCWNKSPKD